VNGAAADRSAPEMFGLWMQICRFLAADHRQIKFAEAESCSVKSVVFLITANGFWKACLITVLIVPNSDEHWAILNTLISLLKLQFMTISIG